VEMAMDNQPLLVRIHQPQAQVQELLSLIQDQIHHHQLLQQGQVEVEAETEAQLGILHLVTTCVGFLVIVMALIIPQWTVLVVVAQTLVAETQAQAVKLLLVLARAMPWV